MIEELVFSQLLTNDEYARIVLPHLKDDYFSSEAEKAFFKIYKHFFSKHNKIPSRQAMRIELENIKAAADLYTETTELVNRTVEFTETLPWLIEKTEEFCKEKALFNALRESVLIVDGQSKTKTKGSIPTLLQEALSVCFDTSVGHNYFDDASARYDYYHLTEARIQTGIPIIDKITKNGFPRKTFNVLLAPPHGGKSMVLVNIGAGALLKGYNVLYISMEMAAEEIGKRFDVNLMDVDFETLEVLPKATFDSKFNKIASGSRGKLVIKEYPTQSASAANFRALLQELKTKQNFTPDMIIIDYMNICASEFYKNGSNHNSYTVIGSVGKELRAMAIEHNAAIISATQTNRSGVGNSDIDMTAVSDSASTTMIADWMLAIINTDDLKQMKQLLFKQIKNRYSGISDYEKFLMGVDYSKMKLFELDITTTQSAPQVPDKKKKGGKDKTLNTNTDGFNIDMLHQIQPAKPSFNDFNFD